MSSVLLTMPLDSKSLKIIMDLLQLYVYCIFIFRVCIHDIYMVSNICIFNICTFVFSVCVFLFLHKISLCSSCCHRTHSVGQAGLELIYLSLPLRVLGSKLCTTTITTINLRINLRLTIKQSAGSHLQIKVCRRHRQGL